MLRREYLDVLPVPQHLSRERVELDDTLHLVSPELDTDAHLLIGRQDLQGVPPDAEASAGEVEVVTLVLHVDELPDEAAAVTVLALPDVGHEALVLLRRA